MGGRPGHTILAKQDKQATPPQRVRRVGPAALAGVAQDQTLTVGGAGDRKAADSISGPQVKLDLFYAQYRMIGSVPKRYGIYRPCCSHLRDTLATPDPEALLGAKEVWKARHPN